MIDIEQKKLVRSFLSQKFSSKFTSLWLNDEDKYQKIFEALGWLANIDVNLLSDPKKIYRILDQSLKFSNTIPPICIAFNQETAKQAIEDENKISQLPDLAYYNRKTNTDIKQSPEFTELKEAALANLQVVIRSFAEVDFTNPSAIKERIEVYKKKIAAEENKERKQGLKNALKIFEDYNKIQNLKIIHVPDNSEHVIPYCVLAESAGGVTEKVSLIQLELVEKNLKALNTIKPQDANEYLTHWKKYGLSTQAIIKLPKHDKITEVQREAIALNLSRLFGYTTTQSAMIEYNGKPALFVPFDTIQLMSDFASGEKMVSRLGSWGKEYMHYSTIKTVGEGLMPDQCIQDFGDTLSFFYLCNDPDAFGGYNQNKALKESRELFIFDQVLMSEGKFALDTRFSLLPSAITRHTRHDQGRNRTLVEDSSFDKKFASVVMLLNNRDKIATSFEIIRSSYASKITDLKNKERVQPLTQEEKNALKDLLTLYDDTIVLQKATENRIAHIFDNFPKLNNQAITAEIFLNNQEIIKQALILEKIVNKPVLFAEDGRRYKHPWTDRNENKILNIKMLDADKISISFSSELEQNYLSILAKKAGVRMELYYNTNSIVISKRDLLKLYDGILLPENNKNFNLDESYLNLPTIEYLKSTYEEGHRTRAMQAIENYINKLPSSKISDQIDKMRFTTDLIKEYTETAKNKGFLKHLQLQLQFDIQKRLQTIIRDQFKESDPKLLRTITEAFNAAIKLDRIEIFNNVLMSAIENNCYKEAVFNNYLNNCIAFANNATNYNSSSALSGLFQEISDVQMNLQLILHKLPKDTLWLPMLNEALNKAMQLNMVAVFNGVLSNAIEKSLYNDDIFRDYLIACSKIAAVNEDNNLPYSLRDRFEDLSTQANSQINTLAQKKSNLGSLANMREVIKGTMKNVISTTNSMVKNTDLFQDEDDLLEDQRKELDSVRVTVSEGKKVTPDDGKDKADKQDNPSTISVVRTSLTLKS